MLTPREIAKHVPFTSGDNFIINGGCVISQRGDFWSAPYFTSLQEYTIDRFATLDSANTPQIQQNLGANLPDGFEASLITTATETATSYIYTGQWVEDYLALRNRDVVLSAWVKSNNSNTRLKVYQGAPGWTAEQEEVGVGTHPGDGQWHKLTMKFKVSPTATELRIAVALRGKYSNSSGTIPISAGDYYEFTGLKLEVGTEATPYVPRTTAEELALCQRYYERIVAGANYYVFVVGQCISSATAYCDLHWTPKRVIPSLNYGGSIRLGNSTGTPLALVSLNFGQIGLNGGLADALVGGGLLTAGNAAQLMANNDTTAYIEIDAEITS